MYNVSDSEYWELVAGIWQDSENINQNISDWRKIWQSVRPESHLVMDDEDQQELADMPDRLIIYRGVAIKKGIRGLSWTLDRDIAIWFAKRLKIQHNTLGYIVQSEIRKSFVKAYFTSRNEKEIVVLPRNCENITVSSLIG